MTGQLIDWISGDLSTEARIWTALAPGVLAAAVFVLGLVPFGIRCFVYGMPRDAETVTRGKSVLVGFFLRHYFFWLITPLWNLVLRSGLPANALTALSALLGLASGVAVAAGRFALGGWLFLFSGMLDVLDGRVARARQQASPAGAAIDSVLDRYTDSAILIGLAWYYRETWVLLPVLLAFLGSSLVPYVRARGEGLGVSVRGGIMQRLERVLYLGTSVALAPILEAAFFPRDTHPMHWLTVLGVTFLAVTSNITAVTRFATLVRSLAGKREGPPPGPSRVPAIVQQLGLNALAGAAATAVDFLVVVALVESWVAGPVLATALGSLVGAFVNFGLNRAVTFRSRDARLPQAGRYALVSATSLALNAGGMALFAPFPVVPYRVAWWITRGLVYFLWNFPLQRTYVFGPQPAPVIDRPAT